MSDVTARLHDLFDRHWSHLMAEHPELATMTGWPEHHDRWTDVSVAAVERRRREAGRWLDELASIDRDGLGDEVDRRSHDVFGYLERAAVEAARFPGDHLPVNQLDGPQTDVPFLLGVMGRSSTREVDDLLGRVAGVPYLVDQTIELLHAGLAMGLTPPRVCLRDVPAQVERHLTEEGNPVLAALDGAPEDARHEARALVLDGCIPAFDRLHGFLVGTYLPAARETTALADLPDGREWYAERVRHHTTTDLTAEEIHEIGLAEVARITAAMDAVMASTDFTGDRRAFAEHLRTDPRFYFDREEALLAAYRDIAKRVDASVLRLFSRLPRLPFAVVPVPPEQAPSQPAAYYLPGSLDLARPGLFHANTYDLASRPSWNMEAICLHEAVPGHHFQIALAQETEGLPQFRRQGLACTAYIEGWGLYCESLGDELGLYLDPYQRYGALDAELLRACRLVLDTGLHALGWSRERAIDYFVEHSPSPEHELVVEVDRYLVWPGQALAYKVGELRLQELRRRAAAACGEGFDVRSFHDELLRHGALPLAMLDPVVDEWCTAQ